jgi:leucyl aminopeptidase
VRVPDAVLSPAVFAQRAQELSKLDIKVTVLDEKQLRELHIRLRTPQLTP